MSFAENAAYAEGREDALREGQEHWERAADLTGSMTARTLALVVADPFQVRRTTTSALGASADPATSGGTS